MIEKLFLIPLILVPQRETRFAKKQRLLINKDKATKNHSLERELKNDR
jgi:hypothetical protein